MIVENARSPAISPDATSIAFTRLDDAGNRRIFSTPLDGKGEARQLSSTEYGLWHHSHPAWSPSGKEICYSASDGLWLMPADGGEAGAGPRLQARRPGDGRELAGERGPQVLRALPIAFGIGLVAHVSSLGRLVDPGRSYRKAIPALVQLCSEDCV